jgi:putative protease
MAMADIQIGKITHYYDKINVAVVELTGDLKLNDTIKIIGHGNEFTQQVDSIQIEHEKLEEAHKDQEIGLHVDQPVKEGDAVFKI